MLLRLIPTGTSFNFLRWRNAAIGMSGVGVLVSILLYAFVGLNYGIDFRGGILVEVKTPGPANLGQMRSTLNGLGLGEIELQEFGEPDDVLIRVEQQPGGEKAQQAAVEKVRGALGSDVQYRRVEFVGPKVGSELIRAGVTAVVLSLAAMLIYIWFRFEWQFGLAAVTALLHDVVMTIGVFSLLGLEFNLTTVAAILTIAGYSINDTVVVFDRIRENMRKYKTLPLIDLLNLSVNETLSRTILTSLTTLIAVVTLFLFGGEVIRGFSFAMIWGILVGTYSSIFVASPLLIYLNVRRGLMTGGGEGEASAKA